MDSTMIQGSAVINYLPPTSVIIQSGIARLTIAKTSAAMNKVPEITVNLSIFSFFFHK